jgi:hypothetical protein
MSKVTTVSVYPDDLAWLQQRQLAVSAAEKRWLTMPELMHHFVLAVQEWEAGAGA